MNRINEVVKIREIAETLEREEVRVANLLNYVEFSHLLDFLGVPLLPVPLDLQLIASNASEIVDLDLLLHKSTLCF